MDADLRACSIEDLELETESVDLILTDPPYPREFLPVWGYLAECAARVLKPGGSLVAMSGHLFLPDVLRHLDVEGIDYKWTIACMTPGANGRIWPRKVYQGWKPILWYSKGKADPKRWIEDRIVSRPDKRFHSWGQDLNVFRSLALSFSSHGDLVLDPFLGGGTTAVAAKLTHRNFVGCDIDPSCIRKTEARLTAADEYLATLA